MSQYCFMYTFFCPTGGVEELKIKGIAFETNDPMPFLLEQERLAVEFNKGNTRRLRVRDFEGDMITVLSPMSCKFIYLTEVKS